MLQACKTLSSNQDIFALRLQTVKQKERWQSEASKRSSREKSDSPLNLVNPANFTVKKERGLIQMMAINQGIRPSNCLRGTKVGLQPAMEWEVKQTGRLKRCLHSESFQSFSQKQTQAWVRQRRVNLERLELVWCQGQAPVWITCWILLKLK